MPRGEFFAVCEALRLAVLPIRIHTDHKAIFDGIEAGNKKTCEAKYPHAELWRIFWRQVDDLGGIGASLSCRWVPVHCAGDEPDAIGNRWADVLAKRSVAMHELPEDAIRFGEDLRRNHICVLQWRGRAAAALAMPPDRTPKRLWPKRTAEERKNIADARLAPAALNGPAIVPMRLPSVAAAKAHPHSQSRIGGKLAAKARQRVNEESARQEAHEQQIVWYVEQAEAEKKRQGVARDTGDVNAHSIPSSSSDIVRTQPILEEMKPPEDAGKQCRRCGSRRRLCFVVGRRSRATCPCERRLRRRLNSKQPDLHAAFDPTDGNSMHEGGHVSRDDAVGHMLMISDGVTWCNRCGAYSTERIHALGATCAGQAGSGQQYRFNRMRPVAIR